MIFNSNRTVRITFRDNDRAEELICFLNQIHENIKENELVNSKKWFFWNYCFLNFIKNATIYEYKLFTLILFLFSFFFSLFAFNWKPNEALTNGIEHFFNHMTVVIICKFGIFGIKLAFIEDFLIFKFLVKFGVNMIWAFSEH